MGRRFVVAAALAALGGCSQPPTPVPPVELATCTVPGVAAEARCGTYEVWEDRRAKSGLRIPLNIVVLPARGSGRQPDPVVYFDGGPGAGATGSAAQVAALLRDVNESRDLVFIDVRGTGRSGALDCALPPDDAPLQRYFDEFLSDDFVRACLDRQQVDVRFYTQPIAIDDVDEVRQALGYERINLFGSSGGTRQEQLFMRRHAAAVRSVVMHGVQPMDAEMPLAFSRALETGLREMMAGCARDAACAAAHPDLRGDWERAVRRFDGGAVEADATHPRTGRRERVRIAKGVFADGIRHMLYNLDPRGDVAERIAAAARGEFEPFARAEILQVTRYADFLSLGFFLSSTCAEDVRFIDEEDVRRATAGTFLGDYRVRRQQAACRIWPRGEGIDDGFQRPVTTDVPVLVISGDADVATPATDGERVARALPNAMHVVFPHQGHGLSNPDCASRLIAAFVAAASTSGLDTGCVASREPADRR